MGGWWWGSQSTSSSNEQRPSQDKTQSQPPSSTTDTAASAKPLSRDEQSLADLRALFTSIDPERAAAATAAVQSKSEARAPTGDATADDEDSLYPTSMKCAACFDQAYYCSSLGGQLTNIYRYGGMRSCTDLWAQWRFCMRTKAMGAEERRERIREWEQRKVVKYKLGRSSEDVWSVRETPVEAPFAKDLDKGDEEQIVLKAEC